ncbi:GNAT family N-acetyltransferase [Nocardia sp. alder85J]|uniref:GNAT family N-acetyltransferase n=1 Tax=Nocardia sp. alder85J TaxID=2862949 RepID=UPI001CD46970|nr:GNAT family N-acetyltransferase [Nocardia sp. alder85J]MCX4096339.1 GNAT family N-acetyltransferase [Nocardia sp. alder85J]
MRHIDLDVAGAPTVRNNPALSRFELYVGGELAGAAEYQETAGERAFVHTEIDTRGRGHERLLVQTALDDTRADGAGILPMCSLVRLFIETHPEYGTLVPHWARESFGLE